MVITLAPILTVFMLAWLSALAAVVLGKVLLGSDRAMGLLVTQSGTKKRPPANPERVALFTVFLGAAGLYFIEGVNAVAAGPVTSLPEVPQMLVELLVGGNALYLSGKLIRS